ncbi:MAG TPA: hypothetical protein VGM54_19575 [Chthoniobacter sp.]|jgi:hypothetical protein
MSQPPPIESISDEVSHRAPFRAGAAAAATVAGGLLNLYLAIYEIPHFAGIFHDRLPRQSLPAITAALLDGRWSFVVLACLWPLLAIGAIWTRRAQLYIVSAAILITLQVTYTVIAIYMPLFAMMHRLSGGG